IAAAANPPVPFVSVQVYDPAIADDLSETDAFDPARDVIISIGKPRIDGVDLFVFQSAVAAHLAGAPSSTIAVGDLAPNETFAARGLSFRQWLPGEPLDPPPTTQRIDPTPYVRDFVPQREVAEDLSPWLLVTAPEDDGSVAFRAWGAIAARRLMAGLVSRAW